MADLVPLRLGMLSSGDVRISRSGIRWTCAHGQSFRKGDVLGYCNIALTGAALGQGDLVNLDVERWDLQVALIANLAGRLQHVANPQAGGWHDRQSLFAWDPQAIVAAAETSDRSAGTGAPLLSHHFVAGRRAAELAEDRSGLLTGWHDRARAWRRGGADGDWGSVLALGVCELQPVIRGERGAFIEVLGAVAGPAHAIAVPDSPLVHSARIIIEQLRRSPEDAAAIAAAFGEVIAGDPAAAPPGDWTFAAMTVQALQRSPTAERYDLLTPQGVTTVGPADAIILSINSEASTRLRHRTLGFFFDCHDYRLQRTGPAMRGWLARNFEWVPYPVDEVRRDYLEMIGLLRAGRPHRQILVLNAMSTLVGEDIASYEGFDAPLGLGLQSVRARELNAMLHDIARETGIAIIDADAIGAELGSALCIPDGVHQNGVMQAELRREILAALHARGVPGFVPRMVRAPRTTRPASPPRPAMQEAVRQPYR